MPDNDLIKFMIMNTIGESVLIETLRSAAYFVTRSSNGQRFNESSACYLFVQGTGLDVLIQRFHLDYDPEKIRDTFNYCVRHAS